MPKIFLIGFRGTGGFKNPKYQSYPALIKAGHIGIQFEDDERIFGFHPTQEAAQAAGGEDALLELLIQNKAQDGALQDDTAIFQLAYRLSQHAERTEVWVLVYEVDDTTYLQIRGRALEWYNEGKIFRYNLPRRDGTFVTGEQNCAIFPHLLGIEIPVQNGLVFAYIQSMKEKGAQPWKPNPPTAH